MRPRLIHLVPVTVAQIDAGATTIDPVYEQPVGATVRTEHQLSGQVTMKRGDQVSTTRAGRSDVDTADGHVAFEIDALTRAGVTLHQGDSIVRIAGEATAYRILRLERHAAYGGRFWHLYAFFTAETNA